MNRIYVFCPHPFYPKGSVCDGISDGSSALGTSLMRRKSSLCGIHAWAAPKQNMLCYINKHFYRITWRSLFPPQHRANRTPPPAPNFLNFKLSAKKTSQHSLPKVHWLRASGITGRAVSDLSVGLGSILLNMELITKPRNLAILINIRKHWQGAT